MAGEGRDWPIAHAGGETDAQGSRSVTIADDSIERPRLLTVYGARWCPQSAATRRWLGRHGVDFDYVDVNADEAAAELVLDLANGNRSVPTLFFPDGRYLVEPRMGALHELLGLPEPERRRWWWPF